jgi:hypothetical protein
MEIKIIVYLVAGIFWFIFNNKKKVKKDSSKIDLPQPFQTAKAPVITQTVERQIQTKTSDSNRRDKALQDELIRSPKPNSSVSTKKNNFIASETANYDVITTLNLVEIDSNGDYEQNSIGNRIGEDIRNGNIDLRQAVVINELLRPVYF